MNNRNTIAEKRSKEDNPIGGIHSILFGYSIKDKNHRQELMYIWQEFILQANILSMNNKQSLQFTGTVSN